MKDNLNTREENSKEIVKYLNGEFPEKFYCNKCGSLIIDKDTSEELEVIFKFYCDICECDLNKD